MYGLHGSSIIDEEKHPRESEATALSFENPTPATTIYLQNCPVCGRPLEIAREYRGRQVNCRHCGGKFVAIDPASPVFASQNGTSALLRRAEQLLALCERKRYTPVAS